MKRDNRECFLWGFVVGVAFIASLASLSGCSALDPPMRPPIASTLEAWSDNRYIKINDVVEMRHAGGTLEFRKARTTVWRMLPPGLDWEFTMMGGE